MSVSLPSATQSTYAPAQALLTMLQERLSGEVAAIHAAALEVLSGQHGPAASAVRMSINVEPQAAPEPDRETDGGITQEQIDRVRFAHAAAYNDLAGEVRPLPGARALLTTLTEAGVPWAIATSGRWETAGHVIASLEIPDGVPVVTRDQVAHAKPDPDLFEAAAERLGVNIEHSIVVGDSIWDLLAARRALGVGLLSGGYSVDELQSAGAYRVYEDPADLLLHLDEVGVRRAV